MCVPARLVDRQEIKQMMIRFSFTCPHCGLKQLHTMDTCEFKSLPAHKQYVTNCDFDAGGCDEPVAVFLSICPEAVAYKIEKKGINS
jgi:predicted RNA-binding Zn-ribbon protein involved in translation (DUF1610 family)